MHSRSRRVARLGVLTLVVVSAVSLLRAASPTFWTVSSQADFLKGDVEGLSIDSSGRVFPGPAATLLAETAAPFLWTVIAGEDGTLWAGSGNEGKVFRVGKDGAMSTFFDAPELEVHAIAPAPGGGLYVATSPDGKIYRVAPDGSSSTFFDPEDKYIWALAVDSSGNLYAATGDKGQIYRIDRNGKGAVLYKASVTNVVSLVVAPNGDLIAGTESPGRVFRIDASGKAFVLLDSPYREIHRVRIGADGNIYATAIRGGQPSAGEDRPSQPETPPAPPPIPTVSTEITTIAVVDSGLMGGDQPPPTSTPSRTGKGAIYRIRPDGLWDEIWDSGDDVPYDLIVEPDGSLLVGTGSEGKIFRVSGDPARATLLTTAGARQVTALLREASGRVLGATSNPGKLFALSATPGNKGTYDSEVKDAGTVASWGVIRWRAAAKPGEITIFTRSGNTATPDETWSAWSKPYSNADGEQITSPNARYLQWRAILTSSSSNQPPVLTSVTAAYLPRNLRPEITSITVHPPGTVFQRPFSTGEMEIAGYEDNTSDGRQLQSGQGATPGAPPAAPPLGRRTYQKGLQTLVWKAEDANQDRLQFTVLYRREGETSWKTLRQGLWDPIYVWDTTTVPDGTYVVKIAASDAPSNSPGTALVGERESVSFDIDNTPPRIDVQPATRSGVRATIVFTVRDAQSPVQRVEYSLDASRWRMVYPRDGIPDSRSEEFEITLDEAEAGRSVTLRATDAMNNVATAVAEIRP